MFDYQFVGMVAVVLLACDLGDKWLRGRRPRPSARESGPEPVVPDADLGQWMAAVERVLGSKN
jgi:hypothetical protein